MEVKRCPNGHYYDPEISKTCPQCAAGKGKAEFTFGGAKPTGQPDFTLPQDYSQTEPTDGAYHVPDYPGYTNIPSGAMETEAFVSKKSVDSISKTTPVDDESGKSNANKKVQNYPPTLPTTPPSSNSAGTESSGSAAEQGVFNPVTGWLVCIEGPGKGTDYRVRSQYNYIGRAVHMDICISGDEHISAERAALLAYDDVEKQFFIAPSMGHNSVRLNSKMVMVPELLHPYDRITVGKTTLLFIPLCGEQFDWAQC